MYETVLVLLLIAAAWGLRTLDRERAQLRAQLAAVRAREMRQVVWSVEDHHAALGALRDLMHSPTDEHVERALAAMVPEDQVAGMLASVQAGGAVTLVLRVEVGPAKGGAAEAKGPDPVALVH